MQEIGLLKYLKSLSLVTLLAAGTTVSSHAASITYSLVNATSSAGSLTGTVELDSFTKLVTSANVTLDGTTQFSSISSESTANGMGRAFISTSGPTPHEGAGELALYYDLTSFADGFGILNLCLRGSECGERGSSASYVHLVGSDGTHGPVYLASGELAPLKIVAAETPEPTPEPSSLILLGTGIFFSAIGLARFSRSKDSPEQA